MKMVKVKTWDLTQKQRDYATAVAIGWEYKRGSWVEGDKLIFSPARNFSPSTDWLHAGIVARHLPKDFELETQDDLVLYAHEIPAELCEQIIWSYYPGREISVPEGNY